MISFGVYGLPTGLSSLGIPPAQGRKVAWRTGESCSRISAGGPPSLPLKPRQRWLAGPMPNRRPCVRSSNRSKSTGEFIVANDSVIRSSLLGIQLLTATQGQKSSKLLRRLQAVGVCLYITDLESRLSGCYREDCFSAAILALHANRPHRWTLRRCSAHRPALIRLSSHVGSHVLREPQGSSGVRCGWLDCACLHRPQQSCDTRQEGTVWYRCSTMPPLDRFQRGCRCCRNA